MPPFFRNYDPQKVVVTFKGITVDGYMEGTKVTAERAEDTFEMVPGTDGDVTRVRNRNATGSVTCMVQQSAPCNDLLNAVALEDELFGTGYGPVMVKDLNGTSVAVAASAWIRKPPNLEYGDTVSAREWVFDCAFLQMNIGGALV